MNDDLFSDAAARSGSDPGRRSDSDEPLAARMRPKRLSDVVGQRELLEPDGPLRRLLESDAIPSLLLWGPPGCGKTTLARLAARHTRARFLEYSAVSVGSKVLKEVMADAAKFKKATGTRTILFLDEIHRFNKAQQDALLPWVERGDVTLIGATTENPSFEVNSALISRTRLFVLKPLAPGEIRELLTRALAEPDGLAGRLVLTDDALDLVARLSAGDARSGLGMLESIDAAVGADTGDRTNAAPLGVEEVGRLIQKRAARYDKDGEEHFNIISALHKSLRNSDVQAGIYWLARMLEAGEDPMYIARRLVRFASEDVGLADPDALGRTLAARDAIHFLGMPEGALALAQAVVYLALAPKSNALYKGYGRAAGEVAEGENPPVPTHIRNAPTRLMKDLGFGAGYIYAHDTEAGIAEMDCLPDTLRGADFYRPGRRGFEAELNDRLDAIRRWHEKRRGNDDPTEKESP